MKALLLLSIVLATLALPASAQWRENGAEVPDAAWSKSTNGFGAMLYLSHKPDDFLKAWYQPTEGVHIETTDTIGRGEPIVAFVIFTGCKPDDSGLCNASVDFVVLRPDGSEYAKYEDNDLWKKKPATEQGTLQLSVAYVGVIIESTDPLGRYLFKASVHDHNAGISLDLEQPFIATETRK